MKRTVYCGDVKIGGDAPVSLQSMTNTKTTDIAGTVKQIERLQDAGCQIVRTAVPDMDSVKAIEEIKKRIKIPLVADIHFDHRLALGAIKAGADKIRINPGNIGDEDQIKEIVKSAQNRGIPIRVGVNSGSLEKDILKKYGEITADGLAESALRNAEILEKYGMKDIVLSLKSSDPAVNYDAYVMVHNESDYPLHIGVTEAGTLNSGKVKSAVGIGALLLRGIGNTMRVSLTGDPVDEVKFAEEILSSAGIRKEKINIISCPTCGRTEVDLVHIVHEIENRIEERYDKCSKNLTIAVMGCVVNGPGEAREADIGVACGTGKGVIFSKGKVLKTISEEEIIGEIMGMVEKYDR